MSIIMILKSNRVFMTVDRKQLYVLFWIAIMGISHSSYSMYRPGLRSVWQQYLTSAGNIYAKSLAFNKSLSTVSALGLATKRIPFYRACTLPFYNQQRFLSSEMKEKLLERIRVASNQGDNKTVEQTIGFIQQNVPEILQLAQQAKKEPITQQEKSHAEFTSDTQFTHDFSSKQFYDEFEEMLKRQKSADRSPLRQVEDQIERNFEEYAKRKTYATINNVSHFPSATWKEWVTRDYNQYMDRVYAWIFDENNLTFTFEPFSAKEQHDLLGALRSYVQTENKKNGSLEELRDLIKSWDPVFGHMCNEPEAIRVGIKLFGNTYNEAIKKNIPLMESIKKNVPYFTPTNEDLGCSYAAGKLIRKHLRELVKFHRAELKQLLDDELTSR